MKKYILFFFISFWCIQSYSQVNLDSLLIGYWPFHGNMNDESALENHGINNDCLLASDNIGNLEEAYEYNGQTSFIEIPSSYEELTLPFSISAWILKSEFGKHEHIFSSSSQTDAYHGVYLSVNPEGFVQISYTDGEVLGFTSRRTKLAKTKIPLNEWICIAVVVYGPNDMIIQYNSITQDGDYSGTGGALSNGNQSAMIGRAAHNPDYWSGKIDEVKFYNRALSDDELHVICEAELTSSITNKKQEIHSIKIYPNPANRIIHVDEIPTFDTYRILDTQGSIVQEGQIISTNLQVNISNLQDGIYILELTGKFESIKRMFAVSQ